MGCCYSSSTKLGDDVFENSSLEDFENLPNLRTHKLKDSWLLDSSGSVIVLEVIQNTSMNSQLTSARISLF